METRGSGSGKSYDNNDIDFTNVFEYDTWDTVMIEYTTMEWVRVRCYVSMLLLPDTTPSSVDVHLGIKLTLFYATRSIIIISTPLRVRYKGYGWERPV